MSDLVVEMLKDLGQPSSDDAMLVWAADLAPALSLAPLVRSLDVAGGDRGVHEEGRRLAAALGLSNLAFTTLEEAALPYSSAAFSLAAGLDSVSAAPDPVAALAELRRVTARGGRIVVVEPVVHAADGPFDALARLRRPAHRGYCNARRLEELAERAGLVAERSASARCTVDLESWLQSTPLPQQQAAEVRDAFRRLPVNAQVHMDVVFGEGTVSFSYDLYGLLLQPS